jgi:hypothetical protein
VLIVEIVNFDGVSSSQAEGHGKSESLEYLLDLRSKLLMTEIPHELEEEMEASIMVDAFVAQLQVLSEMSDLIATLNKAGNIGYQEGFQLSFKFSLDGLQNLRDCYASLRQASLDWADEVRDNRSNYYFLNYFTMKEILKMRSIALTMNLSQLESGLNDITVPASAQAEGAQCLSERCSDADSMEAESVALAQRLEQEAVVSAVGFNPYSSAAAVADSNEFSIVEMEQMGFSRETAMVTLYKCNYDVNMAIDYCFTNSQTLDRIVAEELPRILNAMEMSRSAKNNSIHVVDSAAVALKPFEQQVVEVDGIQEICNLLHQISCSVTNVTAKLLAEQWKSRLESHEPILSSLGQLLETIFKEEDDEYSFESELDVNGAELNTSSGSIILDGDKVEDHLLPEVLPESGVCNTLKDTCSISHDENVLSNVSASSKSHRRVSAGSGASVSAEASTRAAVSKPDGKASTTSARKPPVSIGASKASALTSRRFPSSTSTGASLVTSSAVTKTGTKKVVQPVESATGIKRARSDTKGATKQVGSAVDRAQSPSPYPPPTKKVTARISRPSVSKLVTVQREEKFLVGPVEQAQLGDTVPRTQSVNGDSVVNETNPPSLEFTVPHVSIGLRRVRQVQVPGSKVANRGDLLYVLDNDTEKRLPVFVTCCDDLNLVIDTVLSIYIRRGRLPEPGEVLFCTKETTSEELNIFLLRFIHAKRHSFDECIFCIADLQNLSYAQQCTLIELLRGLLQEHGHEDAATLAIVSGLPRQMVLNSLSSQHIDLPPLPVKDLRVACKEAFEKHCGTV